MNRSALFFGLSSVVALAGFAGACSSTTTSNTGDGSEAGTGSETGTGGGKDAAAQDSSMMEVDSSTAPMGDEACAAETTKKACGTCCLTNHQAGAKVITEAVIGCACQGTGADGGAPACANECKTTACAATPMNPDMACSTCLQGSIAQGGACQQAASDACKASADCVAEQKCIAPCTTKP